MFFFDGETVRRDLPSLGFFLIGDEGSGSALGKTIVAQVFHEKIAQKIYTKISWLLIILP